MRVQKTVFTSQSIPTLAVVLYWACG